MYRAFEPEQLISPNDLQIQVLIDYIMRCPHRFKMGADRLYSLCACPDGRINQVALGHAETIGLTPPFALRLMESRLPVAVTVGERFFRSLPEGSRELERAVLLLCDSEQALLQTLGLDLLRANRHALPIARLIRKLAESPYDRIRLFVAGELAGVNSALPISSQFDSTVLRSRSRGRVVKDLVKARIESSEVTRTQYDPRYLESLRQLANGLVPNDRDWALAELLRLANQGVEIDGLEVSGIQEDC
jgi:hypothetical protein